MQDAHSSEDAEGLAALECAVRRARRFGCSERRFRQSVSRVFRQFEKYTRVAIRVRSRHCAVVTEAAPALSEHEREALPTVAAVSERLSGGEPAGEHTSVLCRCDCGGSPSARACGRCSGTGVLTAWRDVPAGERVQIVVVGSGYLAARIHPDVESPDDLDTSESEFPSELVADSGWTRSRSVVPRDVEPTLDPVAEYAAAYRVQSFVAPIHSIAYRFPQGRGAIEVAGRVPQVLPWSNWNPLKLRAGFAAAVVAAFVAACFTAWLVGQLDGLADLWAVAGVGAALAALVLLALESRSLWQVLLDILPVRWGGRRRQRLPRTAGVTGTFATRPSTQC
jgi:hypothetical protein